MKKLLVAPLLVTVLLAPQQEARAGDGDVWGAIAAVGAVALGAGVVGAAINYACKPYPHSEEIARGEKVEREARNCYNSNTHWYNEQPRAALCSNITRAIGKIESKEAKISNKIKDLEKRQADVFRERKLTEHEKRRYDQQYTALCSNLRKLTLDLEGVRAHLNNLYIVAKTELMKQQAKNCYDKYKKEYSRELNLLDGTTSYYMTAYQSNTLSRMISSWYRDLPYTSYHADITGDIIRVKNKRIETTNEMNRLGRPSVHFSQYAQLRYDLERQITALKTLHSDLCNIRAAVKTLPGYRLDQQEQRRREEELRRRQEEERRRKEEQRRREEERRKEAERRQMQEKIRRLERKLDDLRWQLNHRPANCTECYIEDLQQQIRDLLDERERISVSFSW